MSELVLRNRQRVRRIDARWLRRVVRGLLGDFFATEDYELGIHLVAAKEMAGINESFLGHPGSTDVITFNHLETPAGAGRLHGELFVCVDDAVAQARQFGASWQSEIVRYIIHGLLHLQGHDDLRPKARRLMKREENRALRIAARSFPLVKLAASQARRRPSAKIRL
jgi:probable rRNA maturation factor